MALDISAKHVTLRMARPCIARLQVKVCAMAAVSSSICCYNFSYDHRREGCASLEGQRILERGIQMSSPRLCAALVSAALISGCATHAPNTAVNKNLSKEP